MRPIFYCHYTLFIQQTNFIGNFIQDVVILFQKIVLIGANNVHI